jgi:hypothetical protein
MPSRRGMMSTDTIIDNRSTRLVSAFAPRLVDDESKTAAEPELLGQGRVA